MPETAVRSFDQVAVYFDKPLFERLRSDLALEKKSSRLGRFFESGRREKGRIRDYPYLQPSSLQCVTGNDTHPYTIIPEGINPQTGKKLSELDRQMIADSAMPAEVPRPSDERIAQSIDG